MRSKSVRLYLDAHAHAAVHNDTKHRHAMIDQKMDLLGTRLQNVRRVLSRNPHGWANSYWSTVESQLMRKLDNLKMELN